MPAATVVKNYVEGREIDYEQYLTDFVNASALKELNGNKFYALQGHGQQSHAEPDLYGECYCLDFKLLTDSKFMEAKSTLSYGYYCPAPGVTAQTLSKKSREQGYFDIIKLLRHCKFSPDNGVELADNILNEPRMERKANSVLSGVQKKAAVNKNLLFFLTNEYYLDGEETNQEVAEFIMTNILADIRPLLEYRESIINQDTFVSFISDGKFAVAKVAKGAIDQMYPLVGTGTSKDFVYLYSLK